MGDRDDLRGRTLGEFIIRERIGEGGFGAVYRCEQPLLGREAVIKVLHHGLRGSEVVLQRFMREAQLASRLDHPYAAHVYAFGVDKDDGLFWIAMEMVQGTGLDHWLRDRGKLPLDQLVSLFERIAEVVQTAHERGIVHRDLKPSNIMVIERAGRLLPKLLDFGIAKLHDATEAVTPVRVDKVVSGSDVAKSRAAAIGEAQTMSLSGPPPPKRPSEVATIPPASISDPAPALGQPLTQANATIGSPPYMSPEQWLDPTSVGPRADLYALGIVAYEALVGRRPFTGPTVAALADLHCNADVPSVDPPLPPALDTFFRRALAKRAVDRPANALELAAELRVAAGLSTAPIDLPRLDDGVRDIWLADGPHHLAEAVAALDGSRNVHQARDAARELFRALVRYLLAIALAARAQVRVDRDEPALTELLRAIRRRDLDDDEHVRLLRLLIRPFSSRSGAYPIPGLVDLVVPTGDRDAFDPIVALHPTSESSATETLVRSHLAQLVGELTRLLRAASFLLDYPLVVPRGGVVERWMGLRRHRRAVATVRSGTLDDLRPALLDRDGRVAVLAWPLIQTIAPATGTELELFVFDGRGRHGARLVSAPAGFEHHDAEVWDWLGDHVIGADDSSGETPADERAPYLGLASFSEADADRFVGREREIDAFANRLRQRSLQVVVGASGAGKSSFVHAGVLPSLPPSWRAFTLRPGSSPLASLAGKLGAAGVSTVDLRPLLEASPVAAMTLVTHAAYDGVFVIVIDQLEELFTLCVDASERERFAAVIAQFTSSADSKIRVICTVRDDFLMDVEGLVPLRAALSPSLYLLGNPSRDDLVRTVVEPARRASYELSDPELATDMVAAVADRPGALALLSFTASRLWELRDRRFRQLTRKAYEAMGGVGGALGQHAEDMLATFAPDEQRLVQVAFRHLVTADETRAVLAMAELRQRMASPRAEGVIDKLVAARLLTVGDDGHVEIIHEALITAWPRLHAWVREDAEGTRMREQLATAAKQWNDRGRPRGLLWRDEVLADLRSWRARSLEELTEIEQVFADASRREALRARRIRRGLAVTAFGVLAIAVTVLVRLNADAVAQRSIALDSREQLRQQLADQYEEQGRGSLLDNRPGDAVLYFLAAIDGGVARDAALDYMLDDATRPFRAQRRAWTAHVGRIRSMELSPDRSLIVTAGDDKAARIWDVTTGARVATISATGPLCMAKFDPSGRVVVTATADSVIQLHTKTGTFIRDLGTRDDARHDLEMYPAFDRDGARIATIRDTNVVQIWEVASGTLVTEVKTAIPIADRVEFSPDGNRVVAAGNGVALVDLRDRTAHTLDDSLVTTKIAFSPDGAWLVAGAYDHTARIWDVARGREHLRLQGHADVVDGVTFDVESARVVTTSRDRTVRIWQVASGELLTILDGHRGPVAMARFDARGERLVTASADGTARVWDVVSGIELASFAGHAEQVAAASFVGEDVVTAGADGTVRRWSTSGGVRRARVAPGTPVVLARRPDGQQIAMADDHGVVHLWSVADSKLVAELRADTVGSSHGRTHLQYDATGHDLAVFYDDSLTVWRDDAVFRSMRGSDTPSSFAFVRPGTLVIGRSSGAAMIWDYVSDKTIAIPGNSSDAKYISVSPDHRRVAIAFAGGTARVWSDSGVALASLGTGDATIDQAIATSGDRTITVDKTGGTRLWDAHGALLHAYPAHEGQVWSAVVSDDGRSLATVGLDGIVHVSSLEAPFEEISSLRGHMNLISDVMFSDLVFTVGVDDTVKVWRPTGGRLLASYRSHRGGAWSVIADREHVVSAGRDGAVMIRSRSAPLALTELRRMAACLPEALVNGQIRATPPPTGCVSALQ